ncbi:MAG: polyprenyl synthetase family protein, partial [Bacteroidota bacterium]
YAVDKMLYFKEKALGLLGAFPPSEYKDALELMVNYVVDRKK